MAVNVISSTNHQWGKKKTPLMEVSLHKNGGTVSTYWEVLGTKYKCIKERFEALSSQPKKVLFFFR